MKEGIVEIIIQGKDIKSRSMSTGSFLISLVVSILICATYVLVFSALRKRLRSVYEPRTFIVVENSQFPSSPNGFFSWIYTTCREPLSEILHSSGLDAYFFLRYIVFVICLCTVLGLPCLAVLLPIHLTGNREGVEGLDKLSTINLSDTQRSRHTAHLLFCFIFTVASMMIFQSELTKYFCMRAAHIVQQDDTSGSASTILVKGLSPSCQTENDIRMFFAGMSSADSNDDRVKRVWFNKDCSKLHSLVKRRNYILEKLEMMEVWLIERCIAPKKVPRPSIGKGEAWKQYLLAKDMNQMCGKKGIEMSRLKTEMSRLNTSIMQITNGMPQSFNLNSCFIQFDSKLSAFVASRSLGMDSDPGQEIFDRVYPADVIWSNLGTSSLLGKTCSIFASFLNYLVVLGWAIPIALITMVTQVDDIAEQLPTVDWLVRSPKVSQLLSSVLTPLLVSGLTSQVPRIFRFLARLKGFPTNTRVEMDVQKFLFLFMFFQLFLIVTLTTGLPALVVQTLVNTSESAIILANGLSKASTFFISYLMASCLTTAGNTLLQSQQLFLWAWYKQWSTTPRQKFRNKCRYSTIYWGSVFPYVTNVGAIAIAYALISPAIMLSAIIGLSVILLAFKYRILYCYVPRCVADGDYYPKAIFQLFSGIYCQQISLLGTLLLSRQLFLAILAALIIIMTMIRQHHLQKIFQDMSTRIPIKVKPSGDLEAQNIVGSKQERQDIPNRPSQNRRNIFNSSSLAMERAESLNSSPTTVCQSPMSIVTLNDPIVAGSPRSFHSLDSAHTLSSPGPNDFDRSNGAPWNTSDIQGIASITLQDVLRGLYGGISTDYKLLTPRMKSYVSSVLFEHPDIRMQRPCIWLPEDSKGIALDQVQEMQDHYSHLKCSCDGANIDGKSHILITQAPPDFDSFEVMQL